MYDLLHKAAVSADWGQSPEALAEDWGLDKYDPVAALFGAVAPTVRSKYDPLQVSTTRGARQRNCQIVST